MTPALHEAIGACTAADHYSAMYGDLCHCLPLQVNLQERHLSHALYFQLCKIKYAAWRYRVDFKRARRHSLADVFQDLVAFYLRAALPKGYEVHLEVPKRMSKEGKMVTIQPDICIKRDGKMHLVIEAKTTIGWARPNFKLSEDAAYKAMQERIDDVAHSFGIPENNVIFVFEEPTNVSAKYFLPKFWNAEKAEPVSRPTRGVLAQIYPLYITTDPYYWNYWKSTKQIPKGRKRTDWFPLSLPDQLILEHAERSVVTPLESILSLIQKVS